MKVGFQARKISLVTYQSRFEGHQALQDKMNTHSLYINGLDEVNPDILEGIAARSLATSGSRHGDD